MRKEKDANSNKKNKCFLLLLNYAFSHRNAHRFILIIKSIEESSKY